MATLDGTIVHKDFDFVVITTTTYLYHVKNFFDMQYIGDMIEFVPSVNLYTIIVVIKTIIMKYTSSLYVYIYSCFVGFRTERQDVKTTIFYIVPERIRLYTITSISIVSLYLIPR